jgi:hypothetical protein
MKRPWLAFVFSLLIPGAGLAYLGKWKWALLNFVLVQVPILLIVLKPIPSLSEHIHYILLALAAGSAGVAQSARSNAAPSK